MKGNESVSSSRGRVGGCPAGVAAEEAAVRPEPEGPSWEVAVRVEEWRVLEPMGSQWGSGLAWAIDVVHAPPGFFSCNGGRVARRAVTPMQGVRCGLRASFGNSFISNRLREQRR